jgi:hypothetical protein
MKMEIEELRKKSILEVATKKSNTEAHDALRSESNTIAASIASLETEHTTLREELRAMRNNEPHTLDLLNTSLAETKRGCEEKMRKYEDDMNALLASWTQQQTQLDAWVKTITAQQHELQSTQAQLAECRTVAQKAEAAHRVEKEGWEREEKQLHAQILTIREEASDADSLEEHTSEVGKLRDRIIKQNKAIAVLNAEIVSTKGVCKQLSLVF